ncbi:MAG TPA: hypothetical protein VF113_12620 [Stellaceae bacterium]
MPLLAQGIERFKSIAPAVKVDNRFTPLDEPREHQQVQAVAPTLQGLELVLRPGLAGRRRDQAIELADRRFYRSLVTIMPARVLVPDR